MFLSHFIFQKCSEVLSFPFYREGTWCISKLYKVILLLRDYLGAEPSYAFPQSFASIRIRYRHQMTKRKMQQFFFLEIWFLVTGSLSWTARQVLCGLPCSPASSKCSSSRSCFVLLGITITSYFPSLVFHRSLENLKGSILSFSSAGPGLSASTFLRSADLLRTVLYKGRSGSRVPQTASVSSPASLPALKNGLAPKR